MNYTKEQLEVAIKAKGYTWFDDPTNKGYDVNIIGIRNMIPGTTVTNSFDDTMSIVFKNNGVWETHCWSCTTDPGTKAVREYHNVNGVARLVPGQYRSSHTIRLHQGKYEALCQQKDVTVFRDSNKDMVFNESTKETGIFGINIHHAGADSTFVENWSEGCQVFKRITDFDQFLSICKKASTIHGNSFSYTLLQSTDIK